jgi:enolase
MGNNLTLQQMESLDIGKWMSDVEKEKAIAKALELQAVCLETSNEVLKKKTLEETLRDGGLFTYTLGKKKYKLNVLTKADLALLDNIENDIEAGIEYDIVKPFRYHVLTALDTYLTIKAQTYTEAQSVVDSILGVGRYSVSASNL